MPLTSAALLIAAACPFAPAASQVRASEPPAPPPLVLEALPSAVRASVASIYENARERPHDESAVGRLAMVLHAYEQHGLAASSYRAAQQLNPRSSSWTYLLGVALSALGEEAAAVGSFRRSLEIDPSFLPARVRLAEALMNAGDLGASRTQYEALVRDFPDLAVAHYGLGTVWSALGDRKAAANHYQRAVDAAPQFGRAHYALALALRDMRLIDRARTHLEAYARLGAGRPTVPDPLMDEVRSLRSTARDLIAEAARLGAAGQLQQSIELHLKALEADPTAAQAHVNLISLYGRTGRGSKAEEHYRAALALGSSVAEAHYNYGVLEAAEGRPAEAAEAFRLTLQVDPFHARAHNNLGALLAQQGKYDDAAAHYRQALAIDPQHRGARFSLARLLMVLGRPRESVEHLEKLLVPEGAETPRYKHALATAWWAAGDNQKASRYAADALQQARRLGQTDLAVRIEQDIERAKRGRQ